MKKKKIGVLSGIGPEALNDMYIGNFKYYQDRYGSKYDKDFPPTILYGVPIPKQLLKVGIKLITSDTKNQDMVIQVIMTQLAGIFSKKETEELLTVMKELNDSGHKSILTACTDLPLVITQTDTEVPLINCPQVYANETALVSSL
jgi:aspartate/glutamate racemase